MLVHIIDTETTGLDHAKDDVIEIGIVNFDTDEKAVVSARSMLLKPKTFDDFEKTVPVHGITKALVEKHGCLYSSLVEECLAPDSIFIAHNCEFDRAWFKNEPRIYDKPWVCSQDDIAWPKYPTHNNLTAIALAHGVPVISAHRALEDCMTIARLLTRVGETHDLNKLITDAMRPKALFIANVPYHQKDLAKDAGFRWVPDKKVWQKRMFLDEVVDLKFAVTKVESGSIQEIII